MALATYGQDGIASSLRGSKEAQLAALAFVVEAGEDGAAMFGYAHDVAALLQDRDSDVALAACEAIGYMGASGAAYSQELVSWLESETEKRRCMAAGSLGVMGAVAAQHAPRIAKLLSDSQASVRATACLALGTMRSEEHAADVAKLLSDSAASVVNGAITALTMMGDANQVYAADVAKKLESDSKAIKISAVGYFAKCSTLDQKYAGTICKLLSDDDCAVRQSVVALFSSLRLAALPLVSTAADTLTSTTMAPKCRAAAAMAIGEVGAAAKDKAADIARLLDDTSEDVSQKVYCAAGIEEVCPIFNENPSLCGSDCTCFDWRCQLRAEDRGLAGRS